MTYQWLCTLMDEFIFCWTLLSNLDYFHILVSSFRRFQRIWYTLIVYVVYIVFITKPVTYVTKSGFRLVLDMFPLFFFSVMVMNEFVMIFIVCFLN